MKKLTLVFVLNLLAFTAFIFTPLENIHTNNILTLEEELAYLNVTICELEEAREEVLLNLELEKILADNL